MSAVDWILYLACLIGCADVMWAQSVWDRARKEWLQ